jgi:hypothetical protein
MLQGNTMKNILLFSILILFVIGSCSRQKVETDNQVYIQDDQLYEDDNQSFEQGDQIYKEDEPLYEQGGSVYVQGEPVYVEIENNRFYLRYSTKEDIEAFFGVPTINIFFEYGGEGFDWSEYILWGYEIKEGDYGSLRFIFNKEGKVIEFTAGSRYSKPISIFGIALTEMEYADIMALHGQELTVYYTVEDLTIEAFRMDTYESPMLFDFRFLPFDEPQVWIKAYYPKQW